MYRCLLDIASGLAFLHQKGILHGDLKLGNILLKSTASDVRGAFSGVLTTVLETWTMPAQPVVFWPSSVAP